MAREEEAVGPRQSREGDPVAPSSPFWDGPSCHSGSPGSRKGLWDIKKQDGVDLRVKA